MKVYIIRHGETEWNVLGRYQGKRSDIPLSGSGARALRRSELSPETVFVSPMLRARQTAELIFPGARLEPVPGLEEMDFGAFEGRSYRDMENDADYRAWVDGGCVGRCPGGEDMAEFSSRVGAAFERLLARENGETLVIVAHSGTQRAIMMNYASPKREYFQWSAKNGAGYILETDEALWRGEKRLRYIGDVSCAEK